MEQVDNAILYWQLYVEFGLEFVVLILLEISTFKQTNMIKLTALDAAQEHKDFVESAMPPCTCYIHFPLPSYNIFLLYE